VGQAIARFEECANRSRFSSQVRVAPVSMHDRANPAALRVGEQDEVQSVVIAQTQVGDEPVEPPRNQMLARAVKIPSLHHLNLIPARPLNQPAERWIWFDHEHSHHRLTRNRIATRCDLSRYNCCHARKSAPERNSSSVPAEGWGSFKLSSQPGWPPSTTRELPRLVVFRGVSSTRLTPLFPQIEFKTSQKTGDRAYLFAGSATGSRIAFFVVRD